MVEWINEFQHESLTDPQVKESFTKAMSKYETKEAAIVGGFNAIQAVGKPFKLPESLDKLPDDKTRQEFQLGVSKLLGAVEKPEDLKDIDWLKGSTLENDTPQEDLVKKISEIAVAKKWPKSTVQDLVEFWNGLQASERNKIAESQKQQDAELQEKAKVIKESFVKISGSEDNLKVDKDLLQSMFRNHAGLSGDEYDAVGDELAGLLLGDVTKAPNMAKGLIMLARQFKSGDTNNGSGGTSKPTAKSAYEQRKERWPNSPQMWGRPE
ncbi:MAG: hypothetical protein WC372_10990 [Candidatus Neomarinimicrobiota bacterium]|jgi:hypothetical protein|nr:hypothetical protein [Candidatus Neomarinimicrobiota bacterium]